MLLLPLAMHRRGKYSSRAKAHLDKVVGFFSKVDPILGELVSKSKPSDDSSDSGGKKQSSSKKRKTFERDNTDCSPRKKNNVSSTEGLTISQREKRAMEMLATHLEECGGKIGCHVPFAFIFHSTSGHPIARNLSSPPMSQESVRSAITSGVRLSNDQVGDTIQFFSQLKTSVSSPWLMSLDFSI